MPYGAGTAFESSYVYVYNNPMRFTDLSGKRGFEHVQNPLKWARPLGVGVPFTNLCFRVPFGKTKCESKKAAKNRQQQEIDSVVVDFIITATGAAGLKKSEAALDIANTYEDCRSDNYGPRCVRDVFFSTIGIIGAGGAAYIILGGPANQALFALVDYTTDFTTGQLQTQTEAQDALNRGSELRLLNRNGFEGEGSVRYWDGLPYWHTKGKTFWSPSASNVK
jgi:hypothetical protein